MKKSQSTEYLPVLSRGKHRRPRSGACFMEYASYLAGERWSDAPPCTHPLLAALARQVNDRISDAGRQELLELVPTVIGVTTDDLRADAAIALRAATTALPVVAEGRQHVMALAVLNTEHMLARLDGRPGDSLSARARRALDSAPAAAAWAQRHHRSGRPAQRVFRRQTAPAIVQYAVDGIWQACIPDRDRMLQDVLAGAIEDCRAICPPTVGSADPAVSGVSGTEGVGAVSPGGSPRRV
jgi:hypothetical protein